MVGPLYPTNSLISSLFAPLLTRFQLHWLSYCTLNIGGTILPQGLWTCCSLCQESSFLWYPCGSFPHFHQVLRKYNISERPSVRPVISPTPLDSLCFTFCCIFLPFLVFLITWQILVCFLSVCLPYNIRSWGKNCVQFTVVSPEH